MLAIVAAAFLGAAPVGAADAAPPCHGRSVNVAHANDAVRIFDAAGGLVCLQGAPAAVQLEMHQTTIAAVLSALSANYRISYRSSIPLNETRSGTYAGSLARVVSRLLRGYNYVIKYQSEDLDVVVYDKANNSGPGVASSDTTRARTIPAPIVAELMQNSGRTPHRTSRNQ